MLNVELAEAKEVWLGKRARKCDWPARGVAIEGDFAGIQGYVFKPVPGARGAAKRLRGRSLLVSAITALAAERVTREVPGARIFYSAGGRFLVWAPPTGGWKERLTALQRRLDEWMGAQFRGEVVFHLAGAEFEDGKIPREQLRTEMALRRARTLDYFLRNEAGWVEENFLREPGARAFRCPACLTTASDPKVQKDEADTEICGECDRDKRLGAKLAQSKSEAKLAPEPKGEIAFIDGCYTIGDSGALAGVIHHMPREKGDAMTLEDLAEKCEGERKWLAYLRLDVDDAGQAFRDLENDPMKVQALSNLLHGFFCVRVQEMLKDGKYYWLYPVYGGGDDLFIIGPWELVIDFATYLEREFDKTTGGHLSFSAGISLSKPKQHILTKAEEADIALNEHAKRNPGKASVHIFRETFTWNEFHGVLQKARKVAKWYDDELIPSQMIQGLIALRRRAVKAERNQESAETVRFRPMLHYQAHRNLNREAQRPVLEWIQKLIRRDDSDADASWRAMGFIARYAMLARKTKMDKKREEL